MLKGKVAHILSWIALIVLIFGSLVLVMLSWNAWYSQHTSPILMVTLWVILVLCAIYLFFFASIQILSRVHSESKTTLDKTAVVENLLSGGKKVSSKTENINVEAIVRKLVRGIPLEKENEQMGQSLLDIFSKELKIMSGLVYFRNSEGLFEAEASYAVKNIDEPYTFMEGEGLPGQVAKNRQLNILSNLPEPYMKVFSGLGSSKPGYIAMIPVIKDNITFIVIECAGFKHDIKVLERIFQLLSRELTKKYSEIN